MVKHLDRIEKLGFNPRLNWNKSFEIDYDIDDNLNSNLNQFFNAAVIKELWDGYNNNKGSFEYFGPLWLLFVLSIWLEENSTVSFEY